MHLSSSQSVPSLFWFDLDFHLSVISLGHQLSHTSQYASHVGAPSLNEWLPYQCPISNPPGMELSLHKHFIVLVKRHDPWFCGMRETQIRQRPSESAFNWTKLGATAATYESPITLFLQRSRVSLDSMSYILTTLMNFKRSYPHLQKVLLVIAKFLCVWYEYV